MFIQNNLTLLKAVFLCVVVSLSPLVAKAQSYQQRIFLEKTTNIKPLSMASGVLDFGKSFLGEAYPQAKKATIRNSDGSRQYLSTLNEELQIDLTQFNCVTFVENMIALTQTSLSSGSNFEIFKDNLRNIRYRNGIVDYAHRLHYFSDWLYENEKRGILKNITQNIGGVPFNKPVNYLSSKSSVLNKNKNNYATFVSMKNVERTITSRAKYYIPKWKVGELESQIKNGDIIAITNSVEGMDMAHVGFAIWRNGELYLLHASSQYHKVVISKKPLKNYLAGNRAHTGIMVGRLE